ncbi:YadA C-terminal domain-containing protein [Providencia alcalifaciens]|uniref:YadA-like family protein n=1 Tax=Providencia sp. wls1921 TaxID=2675153 RepID=UPI0012B52E48|nr:YadA-like family protein [Providencia sp. wls1921]MTC42415.1 hypothetical protein [Providencia sp. wls1921]
MKKPLTSIIVASVAFSSAAGAVQDPNKYSQDQHHIMLDIMQVESNQKATDYKVDKINADVSEANKNATEALDKSKDLEGRVSTNENKLEEHDSAIDSVGKQTESNKVAIESTNTELEYQVKRGEDAFAELNNKVTVVNDFDRRITDNQQNIQSNKDRNDAAWIVMVGGKPHLDDNGNFDGFLRPESDKLVMGPNGELYGYKENAGLYGKVRLNLDDHEARITKNAARIDGNDKRIEGLQETKADKTALADLESKGADAYVELNGKVDNIVTAGSTAMYGVIKLGEYVKNNGNEIKGDIAGKVNTIIDNSVTNLVNNEGSKLNIAINGAKETANDFDARITANTNEVVRLDGQKADRTELADLESKGQNAYGDLTGQISKVEGDVNAINGKIDLAVNNKDVAIDAGKTYVDNTVNTVVDAKLGDVTQNITNNVVNDVTHGAKNIALNIKQDVVEGNNETVNNISGKLGEKAKDFQDQIDATNATVATQVARGEETYATDKKQVIGAFGYLEDKKLDKTDFDTQVQRGEDAYNQLNANINNLQTDVNEINGKIDHAVSNKDVAINAGKNYVDNTVNDAIEVAVTNAKVSVHNVWEENKGDVNAAINGKVENITNNITEQVTGDVINSIGDIVVDGNNEVVVNIKNEITNDIKHDLTVSAKNIGLHIRKEIQEGNNEIYNSVKGSVVAKAQDFQDQIDEVNGRVDDAATETAYQVQRGEEAYANLKFKGNEALTNINGRFDNIIEAGNTELTNINNQFTDVNNSITNLEANINAGISDSRDELIAMGKNESTRLENDLRNDGQAAYDDLASRIEKATSEEEINNILNQYKKDQLAKIQAKVNSARPGAEQALADAKENAKKEANLYVKGKIDQAIADNTDAGKDYVKNEIDKAVEGLVPDANDLNDRIEKIENTLDKGKDIALVAKDQGKNAAIKLAAKAPVVKGAIGDKANTAKTYAKTVNAKADAALVMGNDNAAAIITERNDRIQGQRDTLKAANSYTDSRFNSMQKEVDNNRKRAAAGISGVSAMTNIPQLSGNSNYSFGVGIGGFDGEQSIAAGMSGRVAESVILRSSLSTSTQGEVVWGAGVGFEW